MLLAQGQEAAQAGAQLQQPPVVLVARLARHGLDCLHLRRYRATISYNDTFRGRPMMATLCQAYPSEAAARRAIERLRAGGLPPQGAQLITGGLVHDLRREPVGEFLGRAEPDAPVRTFASTTLLRWHPPGTFAGDADRQRAGSFADVDSHVIVHYDASGSE